MMTSGNFVVPGMGCADKFHSGRAKISSVSQRNVIAWVRIGRQIARSVAELGQQAAMALNEQHLEIMEAPAARRGVALG